jgi:hypothetical protein
MLLKLFAIRRIGKNFFLVQLGVLEPWWHKLNNAVIYIFNLK